MKQQDWTQKLRDRMADYEAAVPEGLWTDIEQSLPQQHTKTTPLWHRWVSAAAVLLMVSSTAWWLWPANKQQQQALLTAQQQAPATAQQQASVLTMEKATAQAERPLSTATAPLPHRADSQICEATNDSEMTDNNARTDHSEMVDASNGNANGEQHGAQQPTLPHPQSTKPANRQQGTMTARQQEPTTARQPAKKGRKSLSLGLHANGGLLAYTHSNGVQMSPEMAKHYDFSDYLPTRTANSNEPIWLVGHEERQHHSQPISIGLTVSYPLSTRWTIGTGLVYTRLRSDFSTTMKQVSIGTDQTLHYLGVPLSIQYDIVERQRWRLYASAGMEIDWNLHAKSVTEGVETQMQRDRPQWSMGGAVGAEYHVAPWLGIYVEPGLRYYPDNGSKVQNFFKDHPANWNLQLGIRFNLKK